MDDTLAVRLECLKLAVQVSTAESLDKSMRAPETERVAELTEKFYDLVNAGPTSVEVPEAVPVTPQQMRGNKKPKMDKDEIFK